MHQLTLLALPRSFSPQPQLSKLDRNIIEIWFPTDAMVVDTVLLNSFELKFAGEAVVANCVGVA